MKQSFQFQQRFSEIPDLLRGRKERRAIRRGAVFFSVFLAVIVGVLSHWEESLSLVVLSVGRSLAGLLVLGMVGLVVGAVLTALVVFIYNGILNRRPSLVDLQFVDEVPLVFVAVFGVFGIFWSLRWDDLLGLIGWGLVAMILVELIFKKPGNHHPPH